MDLNKQNKDDLIKHIESQNRIITTKDDRIKSANDRCRLAELKLQRALGYIDKINEKHPLPEIQMNDPYGNNVSGGLGPFIDDSIGDLNS